MESEKKWFVFYTRSRHEKKVYEFLTQRGYDVFLPLQKVVRQWSDRKKRIETPLFNSYIFVFQTEDRIPEILQCPGISWSIRYNNRPAYLRVEELEIVKRFLSSGFFIEASSHISIEKNDRVEVMDGPLKGQRGSVIHTAEGKKFSVALESIQHNIIISIDGYLLKPI